MEARRTIRMVSLTINVKERRIMSYGILGKGLKCIYRAIPIVGDGKHTRHELYLIAIKPKKVVSEADKEAAKAKKEAAKKAKAEKAQAKKDAAAKKKADKAAKAKAKKDAAAKKKSSKKKTKK